MTVQDIAPQAQSANSTHSVHSAALKHITDQVKSAAAAQSTLRIRGGGSKDFYRPSGVRGLESDADELLDTTPLQGIVNYEPSELVVTVRAGTPLAELEAALAEKGQCLPFEPPHFGDRTATVGGMVAAGLAGPARANVGGVRDYVLGLELLNGRAELLRFGGTVMKNVAGYDVSRLMVGAMGTLGLITEVSLKVLPVLPAEATLVFQTDQATALKQLNQWGGQPLPLNASRWQALDAALPAGTGLLHLRLRGAKAAVQAAIQTMTGQFAGQVLDNMQAATEWQQCRDLKLPFFTADASASGEEFEWWRVSVAPSAPPLVLPWPQLIEWHGGLRWIKMASNNKEPKDNIGDSLSNNALLFITNSSINTRPDIQKISTNGAKNINYKIAQRLKSEFDPQGVFNRQRLYAGF